MLAHLCRGPVPKANFSHPSPSVVVFQTHWCTRRYSVPAVQSTCAEKITPRVNRVVEEVAFARTTQAVSRLVTHPAQGFAIYCAAARTFDAAGRDARKSCHCSAMSAARMENARQLQTMVSIAGMPRLSHPVTPP